MAKRNLNDKQKAFVYEYLKDRNATQAAIRAGYSAKTAYAIGNNLLKKIEVKDFLHRFEMDRAEKCGVQFDAVIEELKKIGFANVDPESIRPLDKIRGLEAIAKLLGFYNVPADEEIEDISEAEADVFGG